MRKRYATGVPFVRKQTNQGFVAHVPIGRGCDAN